MRGVGGGGSGGWCVGVIMRLPYSRALKRKAPSHPLPRRQTVHELGEFSDRATEVARVRRAIRDRERLRVYGERRRQDLRPPPGGGPGAR